MCKFIQHILTFKLSVTTKLRILHVRVTHTLYGSETWTLIQADWNKLDSFHVWCQRHILHIRWHDLVSNDEVLHRTGLFDVSYIVRKRRLGLFGYVARLRRDVPANQILQICTKSRDGERPSQEWRRYGQLLQERTNFAFALLCLLMVTCDIYD